MRNVRDMTVAVVIGSGLAVAAVAVIAHLIGSSAPSRI